jgi:PAT family beta-lactamase induction signal transducer AmpG
LPLALSLLAFIFLFKVGEAFLGRMSLIFYREIGFSKSEIGLLSGGLGALTVSVFAILGGFFNARYGLFKGIVIGGAAMASTNLLLSALAAHPEKWLFVVAVVGDQFTTAISTVALVAFVSQLCDRAHTATQYAAFGSLGNLSRTTLAAASGFVVDGLGGDWALFFVITALMVLPSLALLFAVRRRLAPVLAGATTKLI